MIAVSGFAELTEDRMTSMGYSMAAGTLPDGSRDEIAISKELFEAFRQNGYKKFQGKNYVMRNSLDGETKTYTWEELLEKETLLVDWYRTEEGMNWDGGFENPEDLEQKTITSYEDIIGETLFLAGRNYTITGIVDVHSTKEEGGSAYAAASLAFVAKAKYRRSGSSIRRW